jgi:rubrerythrin
MSTLKKCPNCGHPLDKFTLPTSTTGGSIPHCTTHYPSDGNSPSTEAYRCSKCGYLKYI